MNNEQAKLLAAEYVKYGMLRAPTIEKELENAFLAGWKACERKDLPYDAMTETIRKSGEGIILITKHAEIKGSIDIKKSEGLDQK